MQQLFLYNDLLGTHEKVQADSVYKSKSEPPYILVFYAFSLRAYFPSDLSHRSINVYYV